MTSVPAQQHPVPPEHPERPDGVGPRAPRWPQWPAWTAPVALVAGFGAAVVAAIFLGLVSAIAGASVTDPPPGVTIAATVVQDLCLIASALFFARLAAVPQPWHFGLVRPRRLRSAAGGVALAYVGFLLFSYAWLSAIGQTNQKDNITRDLGADGSTAALVAVTFVVCVMAPLAEEFFFRGYFFGALRRHGLWPAALLTGLAFGAVHVFGSPIAFLLPLAFLGSALCLLRERTGSLYPGIAVHCLNNSIALSSSEHWSWQVPVVLVLAPAAIALLVRLALRVWPAVAGAPAPARPAAPAPT